MKPFRQPLLKKPTDGTQDAHHSRARPPLLERPKKRRKTSPVISEENIESASIADEIKNVHKSQHDRPQPVQRKPLHLVRNPPSPDQKHVGTLKGPEGYYLVLW